MKDFNEKKFYSTKFGQAVLTDINNNIESLNLNSLEDFPYTNFIKLKKDIEQNKVKILSFYKYKLLIGFYSGSNKKMLHDFVLLIPNLIMIVSIILSFILKDWVFLFTIPTIVIFYSKSTNSNNKSYLKYIPILSFLFSILIYYNNYEHTSILFILIFIATTSILFARKQFNDTMTFFSTLNEQMFCFLYTRNYIFIETLNDVFIYDLMRKAREMAKKWQQ